MGSSSCVTQVYQIVTRDIRFKLHSPSPRPPLRIENFEVTPVAALPRPGSAVFAVEYRFGAYDSLARHTVSAQLTLVAICATTPQCTKTVHTYTAHLGLPPLVLDIFKPSPLTI